MNAPEPPPNLQIEYRDDVADAAPAEEAVWVEDGSYMPISLAAVPAGDVAFTTGAAVVILAGPYGGEPAIVKAVGGGPGVRLGETVYDVEVGGGYEGAGIVERVSAGDLELTAP